MNTRAVQAALILAGCAVAAYGIDLLLGLGIPNLRHTAVWLVGGVILHDGVLAPAVIVLAVVVTRLLGRAIPAAVAVAAVVLGSVTLVAVPVLGRFGSRRDNPTLLDRHYVWGWVAFAAVTSAVCIGATLWSRRTTRLTPPGGVDEP